MDKQAKLKGAKTSRSETVSIRLDPELRYMAEIGARIQRRSLSSFIEWAVSRSLNEIEFTQNFDRDGEPYPVFLQKIRKELWDVDEPDRFVRKIACVKLGKSVRIPESEVDRLIRRGERPAIEAINE